MALFKYQADDAETIRELVQDYEDLYASVEENILSLESSPGDESLLNALFRAVHTVKGNCGLLGIEPLVDLLQDLESVLDQIRAGDMTFQASIGDLVLLVMDRCTIFLNALNQELTAEYNEQLFHNVEAQIRKLCQAKGSRRNAILSKVLLLLDPKTAPQKTHSSPGEQILDKYLIRPNDDLLYIFSMAEHSQSRAVFWHGRLERVLGYLMALNDYTGQPVDPEQLFVATCMHDIGMSMLPAAVLHKSGELTGTETRMIQEHVRVASHLTSLFPQWHEAKRIIDQHQEHFDGSGYPLGLSEKAICTGAQFLAIVHTFEAIVYGYSRSLNRRRPFMRAVLELNRYAGTQFNPLWIEAFMEVTRG